MSFLIARFPWSLELDESALEIIAKLFFSSGLALSRRDDATAVDKSGGVIFAVTRDDNDGVVVEAGRNDGGEARNGAESSLGRNIRMSGVVPFRMG